MPNEMKSQEREHATPVGQDDRSRLGIFHIAAQIFETKPEVVRAVMRGLDFIPHAAAAIQEPPVMEYMGHSPSFDCLNQGDSVPTYRIHVRECDDGPMTIAAERLEEKRIIVPGRK